MANIKKVMKILAFVELNNDNTQVLHKNKGELGLTFWGIYQTAHPTLKIWNTINQYLKIEPDFKKLGQALVNNNEIMKDVEDFYKRTFWDRMWLDKVDSQHKANEMFVFGVNAGVGRAVRLAQIVSGAVADGLVGPKTIEAINKCDDKMFDARFDEEEIKYYEAIVRNNPSKGIFLNGWKNRALAV